MIIVVPRRIRYRLPITRDAHLDSYEGACEAKGREEFTPQASQAQDMLHNTRAWQSERERSEKDCFRSKFDVYTWSIHFDVTRTAEIINVIQEERIKSKLLFFFIEYLPELAADPNKKNM